MDKHEKAYNSFTEKQYQNIRIFITNSFTPSSCHVYIIIQLFFNTEVNNDFF